MKRDKPKASKKNIMETCRDTGKKRPYARMAGLNESLYDIDLDPEIEAQTDAFFRRDVDAALAARSSNRRTTSNRRQSIGTDDPNLRPKPGQPSKSDLAYAAGIDVLNPITKKPYNPFPNRSDQPIFDDDGNLILAVAPVLVVERRNQSKQLLSVTDAYRRNTIGAAADGRPITASADGTWYYYNSNDRFDHRRPPAERKQQPAAASGRRSRSPIQASPIQASSMAAALAADAAEKKKTAADRICSFEDPDWQWQTPANQAKFKRMMAEAKKNDKTNLEVRRTTHPVILRNMPADRQNGLFAKIDFPKGEVLTRYGGVRLTYSEFKQVYPEEDELAEYAFELGCKIGEERRYLDDNPEMYDGSRPNKGKLYFPPNERKSTLARYANDCYGMAGCDYNAGFYGFGDQLFLIAERPIEAGEEIFVWYGDKYFAAGKAKSASRNKTAARPTSPSVPPPSLTPIRPPPIRPFGTGARVKSTAPVAFRRMKIHAAKTTKILHDQPILTALRTFFRTPPRPRKGLTAAQIADAIEYQFRLPNGGRPHKLQDRIRSVLDLMLAENNAGTVIRAKSKPSVTAPYLYLWNGIGSPDW